MTVGAGIGLLVCCIITSVVVLFLIIKAIEVTDNDRLGTNKSKSKSYLED